MRHIIVAHQYRHAEYFGMNMLKVPKNDVLIVTDSLISLYGLANVIVYIVSAPRYEKTQRELEIRKRAREILEPQLHRITIKEITLP